MNFFSHKEEVPLFYCETGERILGIGEPNHKYIVRGFHLQSKRQYLDFQRHKDFIEITKDEIDFVSYNIDKMFVLLVNSNAEVLEWIRSHITYYNTLAAWSQIKSEILKHCEVKSTFHYYLSLANNQLKELETNPSPTYNSTLHFLRSLLSAEVASNFMLPSLLISDLITEAHGCKGLTNLAKLCLEKKRLSLDEEPLADKLILPFLKTELTRISKKEVLKSGRYKLLSECLTEYAIFIKSKYYKM
ncbi:MAG: hypothetical protein A2Y62_08935 [Candidatus Fischerbacteria bacterium RBG_13_37_8]|uniref:DUF4037 domain-containing protein n=1 Tax=Candidatus Fischerbacteria bacterium RBG_13_37_8 TaxID=1817863 RepID=A0A1F5VUR8_9BACT|nr:MAG: hypothetical protein A2Y62_08935 [Candidatus Fischerbacteria bacterium RBG_13_37_8]